MVGCKIRMSSVEWVTGLLESKFFDSCVDHGELRKNERNLFCIDCNLCYCKHCVNSSAHNCLHRLLQICKYVYHDVVRLHDIQKYLDCSLIQAYKINGEKAVHLNPRPQVKYTKSSKIKSGGTCCEACGRHIQDLPYRFCSIACKVSTDVEVTVDQNHNKTVSMPYMTIEHNHLPNSEAKEISYENWYGSSLSLSESSSSEVIQNWVNSSSLRPKKMLKKRKGFPRRSPIC